MGRSLDFAELSGGLDLESALIYDAVHLLAVSLGHLRDIQRIDPYSIDCGTNGDLPDSWQHGSSILNFMRVSRIPGMSRYRITGSWFISHYLFRDVYFDTFGRRTRFELDIVSVFEDEGLQKVS